MNKRFAAAFTAVILLVTVCFPMQTVYASEAYGEPEAVFPVEEAGTESPDGEPSGETAEPPPAQEGAGEPAEEPDMPGTEEPEAPQTPELGDEALQESEGEQPQEETPPIPVYRVLQDDTDLRFLPVGGDPRILSLPEGGYALYSQFDGVECALIWRYDELDIDEPGRQTLIGDVLLPEGYAFEAQPLTVSLPVLVYDPEGAPTEQIAACLFSDSSNIILPLGTDRDGLEGYFESIWPEAYLTTEAGDSFFCPVTLDFDRIDTDTAGTYYPIVLELPAGVGMTELFAYYSLGVHVAAADEVDLGTVSLYQSGYLVQWLYPAQNPVLWASVDEGEWSPVKTSPVSSLLTAYGQFVEGGEGVTGLELYLEKLPAGHLYKFQVQYDGEHFSKVLVLDLINNSPPRVSGEQGGDRNGGDREENPPPGGGLTMPPPNNGGTEPPPTTEPPREADPPPSGGGTTAPPPGDTGKEPPSEAAPPKNDTKPTPPITTEPPKNDETPVPTPTPAPGKPLDEIPLPKPEPETGGAANGAVPPAGPALEQKDAAPKPSAAPAEYADSYSVTLSGNRLMAMAQANPIFLSFLRDGMRVSVPTAYVTDLALTEADAFTVTLYQPDEDSFAVGFAVNGSPLTGELPEPFSVRIPWDGEAVSCAMMGMDAIPASLDQAAGTADFSLRLPGTYRFIREEAQTVPVMQQATNPPVPSASAHIQTDSNEAERSYSDSWMPVILTALIGLAAAVTFLFWRKKGGGAYGA